MTAAIVYFSRANDNYSVGTVTTGNTAKVAQAIADITNAPTIEIKTVEDYPSEYEPMTELAKRELNANARPAIILDGDAGTLAEADTIYLGYPIWWGEAPMAVYTFLESQDLSGKTIAPFCTHEGSGIGSTPEHIGAASGATVTKGLAIKGSTAQRDNAAVRKAVTAWLR